MSSHSHNNDRQRRKRQQKKVEAHRHMGGSPYARLSHSSTPAACYINRGWHAKGMANLMVLRQAPGGGHAMGAFLIDLWCCGLKDCYGRLDITADQFYKKSWNTPSGIEFHRIECEEGRQLVAGAIRFSKQNGIRLPVHYDRWAALLGGAADWETADLGRFGHNGGLLYMGEFKDLADRLIGCTLQEFLDRPDMHYIAGCPHGAFCENAGRLAEFGAGQGEGEDLDGADTDDDDSNEPGDDVTDDQLRKEIAETADCMLATAREWCCAKGLLPHPRLADAVSATLLALLECPGYGTADPSEALLAEQGRANLERILSLEPSEQREDLANALEQLSAFRAEIG